MINVSEVKKLAEIRTKKKDNLVLTIYLNTHRGQDPQEKYFTVFKDMAKDIENEVGDKGRKAVKKDLKKITDFLRYKFSKKAKGIVIFSCKAENIWQIIELPVSVFNQYFLARSFYIKSLLRILEDYERFCLLLVDKEKARVFTVYLGKIEEHFDVFDEVVGKHKQGGASEARFQRHHEDEVHRHLKRVARLTFRFFKRQKFDRLIIGYTTPEVLPLLKAVLHPWLLDRIVAKFDVEMFAPTKKILSKALKIEGIVERQKEEEAVQILENNLGPKKKGIVGLDDTLFELQEGRVNFLIINRGFKHKGRECQKCKYLDTWQEKTCPLCGFEMRPIKDVVEKAVKKALDSDIKIEFVKSKKLEKLGKIGALLRF
jgi:peptide chain release factor subunit 1